MSLSVEVGRRAGAEPWRSAAPDRCPRAGALKAAPVIFCGRAPARAARRRAWAANANFASVATRTARRLHALGCCSFRLDTRPCGDTLERPTSCPDAGRASLLLLLHLREKKCRGPAFHSL